MKLRQPASRIPCASLFDGFHHQASPCSLHIANGRITHITDNNEPCDPRIYWCPGFINLHAHLELSALGGRLPRATDFPAWVDALRARTLDWSEEDYRKSYAEGLAQSESHGTTTLYDVGNQQAAPAGHNYSLRLMALQEKLGLLASTGGETPSASPFVAHALYSSRPWLIADAARACSDGGLPWSLHLAESEAEQYILTKGTGPFRAWLDSRIPSHPFIGDGARPLDRLLAILDQYGVGQAPGLVIHGNFLDLDELQTLAKRGLSLVHCPESRAWFGHPHPSYAGWNQAGVNICVGTDSLASAESLDLRAQLRLLRNNAPGVFDAEALLSMITGNPGKALLAADREKPPLGRLSQGACADLICLRLPEGTDTSQAPAAALDPSSRLHAVLVDGICTFIEKD